MVNRSNTSEEKKLAEQRDDFATDADLRKQLRKPFSKELLSKVDKGFGKIDTINHAVVTDRLNQIAPSWSYEITRFVEVDGADGMKHLLAVFGSMTIGSVTRWEAGEVERPSTYGDELKKAMSDFIKRAAMRFGVALDLWSKEDLQSAQPSSVIPAAPVIADSVATAQKLVEKPVLTDEQAANARALAAAAKPSVVAQGVGPKRPEPVIARTPGPAEVQIEAQTEVGAEQVPTVSAPEGATVLETARDEIGEGSTQRRSEHTVAPESSGEPATAEQWANLLRICDNNRVKAVSRLNRVNKSAYTKETSIHATQAEVAAAILGGK